MLQLVKIFTLGLRLLAARPAPGLIIIAGMAGLTAVVVGLYVVADTFEQTLQGTGQADRVLVLRAGSTSEINGNIPLNQYAVIRDMPEVVRTNGVGDASRETYVTVNVPEKDSDSEATLPMRGVIEASMTVRPEVKLIAGEMFTPGKFELIAGTKAAHLFANLAIGQTIQIRGQQWLVTGLFSAEGSSFESEVWVDERLLAQSWGRGETFSSMLVALPHPDAYEAFRDRVASDRRVNVTTYRESDYYQDLASSTTGLIKVLGWVVGVIMSLGAVIAAFNTMQSALQSRTREIATLRALGFKRSALLVAILAECMVLSLVGAILASIGLYLGLDGTTLSTVAATTTSNAQVAFEFNLSTQAALLALSLATGLGLVGGYFPGMSAVKRNLPQALRGA